jgi:histidyl-tRNA synthetase
VAKQKFQSVRGMQDVLPEQAVLFDHITDVYTRLARQAGYGHITTPVLEDEALFVRSVGDGTDIVDKEIYSFKDRSDNSLALRPEGTAGVVRAYIEHGLASTPQPVKLFYIESMFRYDRPQAGRYRQHNQLGAEIFGEASPSADAQAITLAVRLFRTLGLSKPVLQINSIGDDACRPKYRKALVEYLEAHKAKLSETDRERLKSNPLRVLDSKEPGYQALLADAPQTLNYLCDGCRKHFTGVLEYLDDLGIAYELNHLLVRGLDYYTRTVFEFYGTRTGAQSSIGGGGRYDKLVDSLGGTNTPAVGFGFGIERLVLEMTEDGIELPDNQLFQVYVASLGEPARLAAFRLIEQLLDGGVGAVGSVDKTGIGDQLGRADRLQVRYAVIIGQKEVMEETVILRDMASGAQEMISINKVVSELQKRFR